MSGLCAFCGAEETTFSVCQVVCRVCGTVVGRAVPRAQAKPQFRVAGGLRPPMNEPGARHVPTPRASVRTR